MTERLGTHSGSWLAAVVLIAGGFSRGEAETDAKDAAVIAGSGLGRAIALAFAAEGASVVAAGRTEATLTETVRLIVAAGPAAGTVVGTDLVVDSGSSA